ncbi:hypothetical protein [Pandoraea vervacti]|nr:hypothetical protein [Pandoraea vervacti]
MTLHYHSERDASGSPAPRAPRAPAPGATRFDSRPSVELVQARMDGVNIADLQRLEPAIRKFLLDSRIGGIGEHAVKKSERTTPDLGAHPDDIAALSMPSSQYPVILTCRKALDLDAVDLLPIDTVAVGMADVGLEELGIPPPVHPPADTPQTAPDVRDIIPKLYQQMLGVSAVFQVDGKWNIGTASGVAQMQARLDVSNLMIVTFSTASTTYLYFAQDIDPHQSTAPMLPVEWLMNHADTFDAGRLKVVDARRRVRNASAQSAGASAFAYRGIRPAISSVPRQADQVIAKAIELDVKDHEILTRLHVNRLVDVEASSADMLLPLRKVTNRAINYLYLRDAGVRAANSPLRSVRGLQRMACIVNEIRDQWILGHRASMTLSAQKLFDPRLLQNFTNALDHAHDDSKATSALFSKAISAYLHLLTALMADSVLTPLAVWDTLKTHDGQRFTSMLGERTRVVPASHVGPNRARGDAAPARAYVRLMDQFFIQHLFVSSITSLLVAEPSLKCEGFYRKVFQAAKPGNAVAPDAVAIRHELERKGYVGRTAAVQISKKNLRSMHRHAFQVLNETSAPLRDNDLKHAEFDRLAPVDKLLDGLRELLCSETFERMESFSFTTTLREDMPTLPVSEHHALRDMMVSTVETAWSKALPREALPAKVTRSLIESEGKALGHHVAQARKPARDQIIERAGQAYVQHLRTHPDATKADLIAARERIRAAAMDEYRKLVGTHNARTERVAHAAAALSADHAATRASALMTQRVAAAAAIGTAAPKESDAFPSQFAQTADARAREREATRQGLAESHQTFQDVRNTLARVVQDKALEKSIAQTKARAKRESEAQIACAADAYRKAMAQEPHARASTWTWQRAAESFKSASRLSVSSVDSDEAMETAFRILLPDPPASPVGARQRDPGSGRQADPSAGH